MIKRILLGLLLMPCIMHTMGEEYYACNYEDDQRIVYSLGNPNTDFEQVTYNKKEMGWPELVILHYGSRTLTIGSKSQSVLHAIQAARAMQKNPISRYEDAERIVYSRGNLKTNFEQVTCDKKIKVPELVILHYGSRTLTIGSKSQSVYEELKAAYEKQEQEIEAKVKNR
jgi:hypothetical protein